MKIFQVPIFTCLLGVRPGKQTNSINKVCHKVHIGPLLFLLYVNGPKTPPINWFAHRYSEGTKLHGSFTASNVQISIGKINSAVYAVNEYSINQGLKLNSSKSQLTFFRNGYSIT